MLNPPHTAAVPQKLVHFNVKARFFLLLRSGAKLTEYRFDDARTRFWAKRLAKVMDGGIAEIKNGYRADAPRFWREILRVEKVPMDEMMPDEVREVVGDKASKCEVFAVRLGKLVHSPKIQGKGAAG